MYYYVCMYYLCIIYVLFLCIIYVLRPIEPVTLSCQIRSAFEIENNPGRPNEFIQLSDSCCAADTVANSFCSPVVYIRCVNLLCIFLFKLIFM